MKYTRLASCSIFLASAVFFSACLGQPDSTSTTNEAASEDQVETNATIQTQEGLISTFPTADLPILDRVSVLNSLRNQSGTTLTHEAEFVSHTPVSDLYAQYKSTLERVGWVEQNPTTQTVGTVQIMSGTFVRDNDTISVAIQTSAGTNKDIGATTILLKIEQVQ